MSEPNRICVRSVIYIPLAFIFRKFFMLASAAMDPPDFQPLIQSHQPNELDRIESNLKERIRSHIAQQPEDMERFFLDLAKESDIGSLRELVKRSFKERKLEFRFLSELASHMREIYPMESSPSFAKSMLKEWFAFSSLVLAFSFNVINTALEFVEALNDQEKFKTLWDHSVRLDVFLKMLLIPDKLIKMLEPIIAVPYKIYATAGAIMISMGFLISFYKKRIHIPSNFKNFKNLSNLSEDEINEKVGQRSILQKLINALEGKQRVVIVGLAGQGKTALIHLFLQLKLKEERRLSDELNKLNVQELQCEDVKKHSAFNQVVDNSYKQFEGKEKKYLVVVNDMHQLATNPDCFNAMLNRFLNDNSPLFLATTTNEGWAQMEKLGGESFVRRVHRIQLEEADDEQCRLVIKKMERKAKHLCVQESAVNALIESSKSLEYRPGMGRLAKITKMMDLAIGECTSSLNPRYVPTELDIARDNNRVLSKGGNSAELEQQLLVLQANMLNVRNMFKARLDFLSTFSSLTEQITQLKKFPMDELLEKKYYLYLLYGDEAFKSVINQMSESLEPKRYTQEMSIQIDERLIEKVFNDLKKSDMPTTPVSIMNPSQEHPRYVTIRV